MRPAGETERDAVPGPGREGERQADAREERKTEVREEPAEGASGRVPDPSPEEAPELLGERSDYPVPYGEEG